MPKLHVHRSTHINASPEKVYETVADYSQWTSWSPWLCTEPDARVDVSSDANSIGSLYCWSGNIVGQGEIEHRKMIPSSLIEDELRFAKPYKSTSRVEFNLAPDGEGTQLTWTMHGSLPWFLFWMKSQMQILIGMDYERGLKMLKEWIETGQVLSKTTVQQVQSIGPLHVLGVRRQCACSEVDESMESAFGTVTEKLNESGLSTEGEKISVYHKFDMKAQTFDHTSGYIMPGPVDAPPSGIDAWNAPSLQALRVDHVGCYGHLGNAWNTAYQHVRFRKLKQGQVPPFEIYKNEPPETPPADLLTEIYLPLA